MPRKRKYYDLRVIEKFLNIGKSKHWISHNVFGVDHSTFSCWMRDNVITHAHLCVHCGAGQTYTLQLKYPREDYNEVADIAIGD